MKSGTSMQLDCRPVRFVRLGRVAPRVDLDDKVAEIRALLRTDMSVAQIGAMFDVSHAVMLAFIKRRRLCDVRFRARLIKYNEPPSKSQRPISQRNYKPGGVNV